MFSWLVFFKKGIWAAAHAALLLYGVKVSAIFHDHLYTPQRGHRAVGTRRPTAQSISGSSRCLHPCRAVQACF